LNLLLSSLANGAGDATVPLQKGPKMANVYRRRYGIGIWHFCSNCSYWPTSGYVEQLSKPTSSELCSQCRDRRDHSDCRQVSG
jgi:hypothetical protein